ncbi:E2F-associated phosphoprotein-like isoform X2 [Xenia sp. Carnegie-2017]|uniref:E2F-associated phosphoprotein-like isoform X2 n=1 Tax=Xenia sp. Carnegie-2017 TaxID=2897299 RepID=UPI001F043564|nr:E2F-associated phosphoprotein-like isoform X2 [Xenia sp. Carnegie-2017]
MKRNNSMLVEKFGSADDFYNFAGESSSDEEFNSSDDDEVKIDFKRDDGESDNDSFEKEMEMELNAGFADYSKHLFGTALQTIQNNGNDTGKNLNDEAKKGIKNATYDEMYFSSGDEEDENNVGGFSSKSKERRTLKTDDELLYDPKMDEDDLQWAMQQRNVGQSKDVKNKSNKKMKKNHDYGKRDKPSTSDAILSCPACLTTLCIDCQRHDTYKNQFRAMFVMNCKVLSHETLRYEAKKQKRKGTKNFRSKLRDTGSSLDEQSELYNPVQCCSCNTEVAVFDKDEVYHFFNVVESLP